MKRSLIVLIVILAGCATKPPVSESTGPGMHVETEKPTEPGQFEPFAKRTKLPGVVDVPGVEVLKHTYYTVYYDTSYKLARHVTYRLKDSDLRIKTGKRKNNFKMDPLLKDRSLPGVAMSMYGKSATDKEYAPGHLAPAADFARNQTAMDETFYLTNIVPQEDRFNHPTWYQLEEEVTKWGCGEKDVTIITGVVLAGPMKKMSGGLAIPDKWFKVVIDETPPRKKIGFMYSQSDRGDIMNQRVVPVAKIEEAAGYSFKNDVEAFEKLKDSGISDWKSEDCIPVKKSRKQRE